MFVKSETFAKATLSVAEQLKLKVVLEVMRLLTGVSKFGLGSSFDASAA